jgi:hypothetical protein
MFMANTNTTQSVTEALAFGIGAAKTAAEIAMLASISLARILQIGFESANVGLSKYVELAELELKKASKRETVKVD